MQSITAPSHGHNVDPLLEGLLALDSTPLEPIDPACFLEDFAMEPSVEDSSGLVAFERPSLILKIGMDGQGQQKDISIIPRDYFPAEKTITEMYVAATSSLTDISLTGNKVLIVEGERKMVREHAGAVLERWMLAAAIQYDMRDGTGECIEKFSDIGKEFAANPSLTNAERVWKVMYGVFDLNPM